MADCFPPEADDLHRRWLPREIFADIGIVDTDAPTEADAVGVEELAAQLAGILGGASKVCPPPPTTPPPHVAAPHHGVQVSPPTPRRFSLLARKLVVVASGVSLNKRIGAFGCRSAGWLGASR
jgi:hypothetical protein